ncbi:MAG: SDR family NAD(P)-dependent oxidoreductase [Burkholderiaceae bacterium]
MANDSARPGRHPLPDEAQRQSLEQPATTSDCESGELVLPKSSRQEIASAIHPPAIQSVAIETAVIVGVGPGLGEALARRLATQGMHVAMLARNAERLDPLARELQQKTPARVRAYACDATSERSLNDAFALIVADMGEPTFVIYSLQGFARRLAVDVQVEAFEEHWRQNCLGAFIVAREAGRRMMPVNRGTIVFVGSTSGVVARPEHLSLAVGKFGLRAMAHVLAREWGPLGIHVAHLIIDADIKEDDVHGPEIPQADPNDLATLIHSIHQQPRSAWTSELDARPWNEKFWEHC